MEISKDDIKNQEKDYSDKKDENNEINITEKYSKNSSENNYTNNKNINNNIEENNRYNNINVNNKDEEEENIRSEIIMSKQIINNISSIKNKITNEINKNKKPKNLFLLKYEDYKTKIKKFNTAHKLNIKTNFTNNSNKLGKKNNINSYSLNFIRRNNDNNMLNKEFISLEKMFKKYDKKEWNTIYEKRFKSYKEKIEKKREEIKHLNEKEKKRKEDEIINYYSNKKKLSKKKIKDISKRLYNEAKRKIIKLEDKKINNIYITKKTEESLNNISRLSHQRSNMNNINYFKKPKKMTNSEFNDRRFEKRFEINNKNNINQLLLYNKNYVDKDLEKIKNHDIIGINNNVYDLEEERESLLALSKRKNLSKNTSFEDIYSDKKNKLNENKINISDTDKLIYEFIIRNIKDI
jgi:hypothetical protein